MILVVLVQVHGLDDVAVLDRGYLVCRDGDVVDPFFLALLLVGPVGDVGVEDRVDSG